MTPQIDHLGEKKITSSEALHTCIFGVNHGDMTPGKTFIVLRVNLEHCSEGPNTHRSGLIKKGHSWENMHFLTKPRHMTPQIDQSWRNEHCSEGSAHTFLGFLWR